MANENRRLTVINAGTQGTGHPSGSRSPRKKPTGNLLKNKIFLIVFVPIILIISAIAVVLIIKALFSEGAPPVISDGDYVYVLPIQERKDDESTGQTNNPFSSSVAAVSLDGIMYNPNGNSYAILISGQSSYIVKIGEDIGKSGWKLTAITAESVKIEKDGLTENLSLAQETDDNISIS